MDTVFTDVDNALLRKMPDKEEVKESVWSANMHAAPGTDGLTTFSLILSYLSLTPFINGNWSHHENIHTQANVISTGVSKTVCFSYSPPLPV